MSNRDAKVFGNKFSCPGCHSLLKFQRPPRNLLHTCPNCRKVLKLTERKAAASHDDELKNALDSLLDWNPPETQDYEYTRDPLLDRMKETDHGVWVFDQPWPEHVYQVVEESVEVTVNPEEWNSCIRACRSLLEGYHRRVTVFRTGEVEEIAVTGHWREHRDHQAQESHMGFLPRMVVRKLNRIPSTPVFAVRINTVQASQEGSAEVLKLFVDVAIDETPVKKKTTKLRRTR